MGAQSAGAYCSCQVARDRRRRRHRQAAAVASPSPAVPPSVSLSVCQFVCLPLCLPVDAWKSRKLLHEIKMLLSSVCTRFNLNSLQLQLIHCSSVQFSSVQFSSVPGSPVRFRVELPTYLQLVILSLWHRCNCIAITWLSVTMINLPSS